MALRRRKSASAAPAAPDDRLVELARRLAGVLTELGLTDIEVESGDVRLKIQRAAAAAPAGAHPSGLTIAPPTAERHVVAEVTPTTAVTVESPMVGTFYRSPSPTAEPYVSEGDVVKEGQVICIIEAMKLMNEIECKVSGRIVRILVENGQPVEYGQPLFFIEP
ncbi:MAG TPA: acetyl-CoA carboxylase biotin carboxyl carrier protein [Methylomirabilota bacterium]|nr:acetyl-CoA carboxylase biotin carboxyl carrier protein [Methylomirabilota bacterium]